MKQLEVIAIVASIVLLGAYVLYGLIRAQQEQRRGRRAAKRQAHDKRRKLSKKLVLLLLLFASAHGMAANGWNIQASNSGQYTTFTITRTNTAVAETVKYRLINMSAYVGQHYMVTQVNGHPSDALWGEFSFAAGDTTARTITVKEMAAGTDAYKYQDVTYRKYKLGITDAGGFYLTDYTRSFTTGTVFSTAKVSQSITNLVYFNSSGNYTTDVNSGKYIDESYTPAQVETSGTLQGYVLIDDGYDYKQKPATVPTSNLISSTGASATYLNSIGYKIYATVCFTEKERDDGYQYIQIIGGNASASYDDTDGDGKVNDPSNSAYKACFELSTVSNATGKQFFPHRYGAATKTEETAANIGITEFSQTDGKLCQQKFKSDYYKDNKTGSVVLNANVGNITARFDAAGSGDDTWGFKDLFVRMALVDATAPKVIAIAPDPGMHAKGDTVYVSVVFDEIVNWGSWPELTTKRNWGNLRYLSGAGSNVLTFRGEIGPSAYGNLEITGFNGSLKDQVGNAVTSITSSTLCRLDDSHAYSITYDLNGGSGTNPSTYTWETPTITLSNPTKTGYTFNGWTGSNGTSPQTTVKINQYSHGDRNYTANWTPNGYRVGFHSNNGEDIAIYQPFTYDQKQPLRANTYTRTGYTFAGWSLTPNGNVVYNDADSVLNLTAKAGGIFHLYAHWTPNTYTVRFHANNGTSDVSDQTLTYDLEQKLASNTFTRTGYLFAGWSLTPNGDVTYTDGQSVLNLKNEQDAVLDLYAHWTPITYTVRFHANNGTSDILDQTLTYDQTQALATDTFTLAGYDLAGWSIHPDSVVKYTNGQSVLNLTTMDQDTVDLYAKWSMATYDITYELGGGSVATPNPVTYTIETDAFTLNNPTRTGYNFAGWTKQNEQTPEINYTVGPGWYGDMTITAHWTPITYVVRYLGNYDGNGIPVVGTIDDQQCTYDERSETSNDALSRYGYRLDYWATEPHGGDSILAGTGFWNLTSVDHDTVLLYAQWGVVWNGEGAMDRPFRIEYPSQLLKLASDVKKGISYHGQYIRLDHDLDMSGVVFPGIGSKFGTDGKAFSGTFNGNNHTIRHLSIHYPDSMNIGLFNYIMNGKVMRLKVDSSEVEGLDNVGIIVGGYNQDCTLEDCLVLNSTVRTQNRDVQCGTAGCWHAGIIAGTSGERLYLPRCYYRDCVKNANGYVHSRRIGTDMNDSRGCHGLWKLTLPDNVECTSKDTFRLYNERYYICDGYVQVETQPWATPYKCFYNDSNEIRLDVSDLYNLNKGYFQVPDTDATITITLGVPYVDENGKIQTCAGDYTLLENANEAVNLTGNETKWAVVAGDVTITNQVYSNSALNLILCDGASLTIDCSYTNAISTQNNLAIFGQRLGTGRLYAHTPTNAAAVYVNFSLDLNGGQVTAVSDGGKGISANNNGSINFRSGSVKAVSGNNNYGMQVYGNGQINLSWRHATDSIYASAYGGQVVIPNDKAFTDRQGHFFFHTLNDEQKATMAGKTVYPANDPVYYIDENGQEQACVDYTVIQSCDTGVLYGCFNCENWYVVRDSVMMTDDYGMQGLSFYDSIAHVIVCDGAKLNVSSHLGSYSALYSTYGDIALYSGPLGTGVVNATCACYAHGIEARQVFINGGIINAINTYNTTNKHTSADGISTRAYLTINGGVVNASGFSHGLSGYQIILNGGQVHATGRIGDGILVDGGDIFLNWRSPDDCYWANGYSSREGKPFSIKVGDAQAFTDSLGNYYVGTLTPQERTAIASTTLRPLTFLTLDANADYATNQSVLSKLEGVKLDVQLGNYTLYTDGWWNTICLPFDIPNGTLPSNHPFNCYFNVYYLDETGENDNGLHTGDIENGVMRMVWLSQRTTGTSFMQAGKPYLIEFRDEGQDDIIDPVFPDVTLKAVSAGYSTSREAGYNPVTGVGNLSYLGTFARMDFPTEDRSTLLLMTDHYLYYPMPNPNNPAEYPHLSGFHGYFKLGNGLEMNPMHNQYGAPGLSIVSNLEDNPLSTPDYGNPGNATGLEEVRGQKEDVRCEKFIENGLLYIRRGDAIYDAVGRKVK